MQIRERRIDRSAAAGHNRGRSLAGSDNVGARERDRMEGFFGVVNIVGVKGAIPVELVVNPLTEIGDSGRPTPDALVAFDRPPLGARMVIDMGCDGERVRAGGRATGIAEVADREMVTAMVVVPDTIRSAGAVRLLAAYVKTYFNVAVEARGQVHTITVSRKQRPELVKAVTAVARCFC